MRNTREFNFDRSRRVTAHEAEDARKAIEAKLGVKRPARGRPPKGADKYRPIQIRLHPKALHWARAQALRRHIGYQTVINQALLALTSQ
jgi:uncharacterized protein (DUF4415 family)